MNVRLINEDGAPYRQGMRRGEIYEVIQHPEESDMYLIGTRAFLKSRFEKVKQ